MLHCGMHDANDHFWKCTKDTLAAAGMYLCTNVLFGDGAAVARLTGNKRRILSGPLRLCPEAVLISPAQSQASDIKTENLFTF